MRQGLVIALLVGVSVTALRGQERDLGVEIRELRVALDRAIRESDRLAAERVGLLERDARAETELETMVASLAAASFRTDVESGADPIRIFGDFRVRFGYTADRDFGNQDNGIALPVQALLGVGGGAEEDDSGTWGSARFLLGFDFQLSRRVMTRLSIQAQGSFNNEDVPAQGRGFVPTGLAGNGAGNGGGATEGVGAFGPGLLLTDIRLYEGFIQFEEIFEIDGLDVRAGRQEIVLGDEFIFGNNEFFGGETFDALRLTLHLGDLTVDGIVAKLDVRESLRPGNHPFPPAGADDGHDDDELYALYLSWRPEGDLEIDLYWVFWNGNGGGSTGTLGNAIPSLSTGDYLEESGFLRGFFHTLGLRVGGLLGALDYEFEFAWQSGDIDDFIGKEVAGIALEIDLGWTFDADSRARLYLRGLFSEGSHGDESGFIPLFPERHSYDDPAKLHSGARYGLMDIIPMDNVFSLQAGFAFDPAADWRVGAAVLWATHDADLRPFAAEEDDIGWEIDLWANYRHSEQTTLGIGLGLFLPDEGAPFVGGSFIGPDGRDEPSFLAYLDLRVLF